MGSWAAWMAWSALVGCSGPDPATAPDASGTPPDEPVDVQASCTLASDNALRAWCDVAIDPPAPIAVRYVPAEGGEAQQARAEAPAGAHRLGLWFMTADTSYDWTVERLDTEEVVATGQLRTGSLPPEIEETWTVAGTSDAWAFAHVGLCDDVPTGIVTRASDGSTLWYQSFPPTGDRFVALEVTEDDTVLAMATPGQLIEVDWMGQELLRLEGAPDERWHHDATRHQGLTYIIRGVEEELGGAESWRLDGFVVFDADGARLATWNLGEVWLPSGPHPVWGNDVVHANSLQVYDDGTGLLSLRSLSTVMELVVDPGAADFGSIRWSLTGHPDADWVPDVELVAGTFYQQHHATRLPDGRVSLFDNGGGGRASRALELTVDPDGGVAAIEQAYELEGYCAYQGAAHRTAAGHVVAVCGPFQAAKEFLPGSDIVAWSASGQCVSGPTGVLPRMQPLAPR